MFCRQFYFDDESSPGTSESNESSHLVSSGISPVDIMFGISPGYTREDLFQLLPPRSDMDRLVSAWFNAPDPLRRKLFSKRHDLRADVDAGASDCARSYFPARSKRRSSHLQLL